ncbi:MAG TPA: acyl-CoA dehydrogenase family protein [Acidimicrobiales bacterium]|nr:acyl-CoA dehydrogenase family protein [Acidimicrobiales bacterium]
MKDWLDDATAWLDANAPRRASVAEVEWGEGSDAVAVFRNLPAAAERAHIDALRAWQRKKFDAGYGAIAWPTDVGGAGLTPAHANAFAVLEAGYATPESHEAFTISMELVGPTILTCGTPEQQQRYVPPLRRADEMWCQLFSEPSAGSDLAALATSAVRDGDTWVLNGQKVWTSGAQYADFGYIQTRTDPSAPKHAGMTAFLVPMDAPGVEVRPLRQMSGGSSFNEVFLTDVRVPDADRLGDVGGGWGVALTTLGFERMAASEGGEGGESDPVDRLVALSRHLGRAQDGVVRQQLAAAWTARTVHALTLERAAQAHKAGGVPGPEGSLGKLGKTRELQLTAAAAANVLGPRLGADSGEWGTYAWSEFVSGLPGFRIAGGTDEIQRNIIGERVLGLPREPR